MDFGIVATQIASFHSSLCFLTYQAHWLLFHLGKKIPILLEDAILKIKLSLLVSRHVFRREVNRLRTGELWVIRWAFIVYSHLKAISLQSMQYVAGGGVMGF